MVKKIFICFLLLGLHGYTYAKTMASINKNPAIEGEPIILTIESNQSLDSGDFDVSQINPKLNPSRANFQQSTHIVNGSVTKRSVWQVTLYVDQAQKIDIKSFQVGNERTSPITLTVHPQQHQSSRNKAIFLKSTLNTTSAYLGQVLHYQVKLFLNTELQQGQINPPKIQGIQFEQLDKNKESVEIIDGKKYRIITQDFSLKLNQTGSFTIPAPVFTGEVVTQNINRHSFFTTRGVRPIRSKGNALKLDVLPPASTQKNWLVADDIHVSQQWDTKKELRVGEPITRTIVLKAKNTDVDLIPELNPLLPSSFKVYPETPIRKQRIEDNSVIAEFSSTFALVPQKDGEITIPEMKIPWWDPATKQEAFVVLPSKKLMILPIINTNAPSNIQQPAAMIGQPTEQGHPNSLWQTLTFTFLTLWLFTLALFLKQRGIRSQQPKHAQMNAQDNQKNNRMTFEYHCKNQQYAEILTSLPQWFAEKTGNSKTLIELQETYPELKPWLTQLQKNQYSKNTDVQFNGSKFYATCSQLIGNNKVKTQSALEELYPN